MERDQLDQLAAFGPYISASDLADQTSRLLLSGYDTDRQDFDVSLEDGLLVIDHAGESRSAQRWLAEDLVPNKRVYWEDTDFDFARLLIERGTRPVFLIR